MGQNALDLRWLVDFLKAIDWDITDKRFKVTEGSIQPVQEALAALQRAVARLVNGARAEEQSLPPYELQTAAVGLKSAIRNVVDSLLKLDITPDSLSYDWDTMRFYDLDRHSTELYRYINTGGTIREIYYEPGSRAIAQTELDSLLQFLESRDERGRQDLAISLKYNAEIIRIMIEHMIECLQSQAQHGRS